MTARQTKWVLRLAIPAAVIGVAMLCGKSFAGAVGVLVMTAFIVLVLFAIPVLFIGVVFLPLFGLYGIREKAESAMDIRNPDNQFLLTIAIWLILMIAWILASNT